MVRFKILFFLIFVANTINAQKKSYKLASASIQAGSPLALSLACTNYWGLGKSKKFSFGLGARLTSAFGSDLLYITAPAKLTSGKTGPSVFFAEQIPANIDSLKFSKVSTTALNLSLNFNYAFTKKINLEFNIDALGFSIGGSKNATYLEKNTMVLAKPTSFNALLISDNDLGTLNSELVASYRFNKKWGARLGLGFLFTEYKTNTKVQTTPSGLVNDRFRNKAMGIVLGANYNLK